MGSHILVWIAVAVGMVALAVWLCLVARAEGSRLDADLDSVVPDAPASRTMVPPARRGPTVRRVADPEYGLMTVTEEEEPSKDGAPEIGRKN